MNSYDFNKIASLLKIRSGLVLTEDKDYLLESRLIPVAQAHGLCSLSEIVKEIDYNNPHQPLARDVVEAMTTNESFFFRDSKPFDILRNQILPKIIKTRSKKNIRIWCAACSNGQEPYSILMLLHEMGILKEGWTVDILATDLSREVLDRARKGIYSQFEVQRGLPILYLIKYFSQIGEKWCIKEELRDVVKFEEFNLLESVQSFRDNLNCNTNHFDIVFCRNVLIYLEEKNKTKILDNLSQIISQDGYLFLGGAETILGLTKNFRVSTEIPGVYEPVCSGNIASAIG